ncbi:DUF368 domain-containing protein [Aliamphritea hakodatensis]|uniref:DUF368 domain-containing protein n=1 Tax=Aliamphritea hakodatensis TaxID=2895352 RepID=UPI0022FD7EB6|nr:DUF368 domain-containing protein [Aliamphritea hakodatensis]
MGAADAVPGVSGGTIAFITGIYEELINSIKSVDTAALGLLFSGQFRKAWAHINGSFLLVLVLGIVTSIATVASSVLFLLDTYPVMLWAFFFGLILASCWLVMSQIDHWNTTLTLTFVVGAMLAYLVTSITPTEIEPTALAVFLSGMVAICAMILPGISGSFILLIIGMYTPVLGAVKAFDIQLLGLFLAGCVVGISGFSRVLSWMFTHYKMATLAMLAGFMLGSLNKIWPWKYTTAYTINRHGEQIPLAQDNVLPLSYQALTGEPSYLYASLALMVLGGAIVLLMERGLSSDR